MGNMIRDMNNNCSYPNCEAKGPINVKYAPQHIRSCDKHWSSMYRMHLTGARKFSANLHQIVDKSTHRDKKTGKLISHKLSVGKQWEIDNRRLSPDDGATVVNRATGKPAQY